MPAILITNPFEYYGEKPTQNDLRNLTRFNLFCNYKGFATGATYYQGRDFYIFQKTSNDDVNMKINMVLLYTIARNFSILWAFIILGDILFGNMRYPLRVPFTFIWFIYLSLYFDSEMERLKYQQANKIMTGIIMIM